MRLSNHVTLLLLNSDLASIDYLLLENFNICSSSVLLLRKRMTSLNVKCDTTTTCFGRWSDVKSMEILYLINGWDVYQNDSFSFLSTNVACLGTLRVATLENNS